MMRRYGYLILWNRILVALLTLSAFNHVRAQSAAPPSFAFVNGWWFNGHTFEKRTGYSIYGRFTFKTPAQVDRTLDLAEAYVVPPFAEAHNHNLGTGAEDRDKAAIQRYLADGVFYVKIQGNLALTDEMKRRLSINGHDSVDAMFAQCSLTATGGHPISLTEDVLLPAGYYRGYTKETLKDHYYFTIDSEADLLAKWPSILRLHPDFIKTFLLFSDQFEKRRFDPAYVRQRGLDPRLLPKIVAKAHAKRRIVVDTTYLDAVPSLIRMKVVREADVRATEAANMKVLLQKGVTLAIGSDDVSDTSIKEIEYLQTLGVLDNLTLLRMWSESTPRTIFPKRQIGALREGFEASFLVLEGDPLKDFNNVRRIKMRFKQGFLLEPEKEEPGARR
jgi:hypothetical protein